MINLYRRGVKCSYDNQSWTPILRRRKSQKKKKKVSSWRLWVNDTDYFGIGLEESPILEWANEWLDSLSLPLNEKPPYLYSLRDAGSRGDGEDEPFVHGVWVYRYCSWWMMKKVSSVITDIIFKSNLLFVETCKKGHKILIDKILQIFSIVVDKRSIHRQLKVKVT